MSSIAANIEEVQQEISSINNKAKIVAISKYVTEAEIIKAYEAGIRDFGESKIQDATKKLKNLPLEMVLNSNWHFIGHIQSNKIRKVIEEFKIIHSVDSLKLAKNISRIATEENKKPQILLQVNVANEESKFGLSKEELKEVLPQVLELESIELVGLMLIAPHSSDDSFLKSRFKEFRELRNEVEKLYNCKLPELSMGMSNDYKIALNEGATMVRLGSIIFK